ncbi:MAG: cytochrome c oxidase subunit II [Cytophagales bacterium]|nr:cytochrome c oxidase subunit II [Cytophagales bacterium]
MNILVIVGVLVLVILVLIFRVQSLVAILRGSDKRVDGLSNRINGGMFLIFLFGGLGLFFWYTFSKSHVYNLPEAASIHGKETDMLFAITMAVIVAVFVIVNFLILFFAYKYQYKKDREVKFYPDNHLLETVWTIIPAIVLAALVFGGWRSWTEITADAKESDKPVVFEIVGQQFLWASRYPGMDGELGKHDFRSIDSKNSFGIDLNDEKGYDDFMPLNIHVPVGKEVLMRIRAKDVIHSVFIPHLRVKMDAVPGMPTQFRFTPTKTTDEMRSLLNDPEFTYEIACTEICGRGHFGMKHTLVVDTPEEYAKWYAEQSKDASFASLNEKYLVEKVPAEKKDALNAVLAKIKGEEVVAEPVVETPVVDSLTTDSTIVEVASDSTVSDSSPELAH